MVDDTSQDAEQPSGLPRGASDTTSPMPRRQRGTRTAGIFVSYRRSDAEGWAGRLSDSLKRELGRVNIFRDIEDIPPGVEFDTYIAGAVGSCDALIALIGPSWLSVTDQNGRRRLDDPKDFIRLEIAAALRRNVRVIPVLVSGAQMPGSDDLPEDIKPLARRQAYELTDSRWADDCRNLAGALKPIVKRRSALGIKFAAGGLALVLASVGYGVKVWYDHRAEIESQDAKKNRLEGTWYAEVAYSWGFRASERFEFIADGERLLGTASFGRAAQRILEGKLAGDRLFFITKLRARVGSNEREIVYEYTGQVQGARIQFTLDAAGELMTRFVAARTPQEATTAAPRLATGGTNPQLSNLISGPYKADYIKAKVGEHQEAIRSCYVPTEFDPVDHVYVDYFVRVGADGKVTEVGAPGSDRRSVELDRCMDRIFRTVNWGPPPNGSSTEIRLGFKALPRWRSQ
jgi:TIR domain